METSSSHVLLPCNDGINDVEIRNVGERLFGAHDGRVSDSGNCEKMLCESNVRIVSLLPSATDICIALGLKESIVAVTHECSLNEFSEMERPPVVVTSSGIADGTSQGDIHQTVQNALAACHSSELSQDEKLTEFNSGACSRSKTRNDSRNSSLSNASLSTLSPTLSPSLSLYPINEKLLWDCQPTLIITQDLCDVCAPSTQVIKNILLDRQFLQKEEEFVTCSTNHSNQYNDNNPPMASDTSDDRNEMNKSNSIQILALTPHSLHDVGNTFVSIAEAVGVFDKGIALKNDFEQKLHQIYDCVQTGLSNSPNFQRRPRRMLLLEWLDPPFDCGHWIPDLMKYAVVDCVTIACANDNTNHDANIPEVTGKKSSAVTWDDIRRVNDQTQSIDCVVVSCCGFQLERNYNDTLCYHKQFAYSCPEAYKNHQIYALNADKYIVNPSQHLVLGSLMLAIIAHADNENVMNELMKLPWAPDNVLKCQTEWKKVNFDDFVDTEECVSPRFGTFASPSSNKFLDSVTSSTLSLSSGMVSSQPDIEDLIGCVPSNPPEDDFDSIHDDACRGNKMYYLDPKTKYTVFTKLAHINRGFCCGSGCRHCPYNHVNVSDDKKVNKIQQPAFLYKAFTKDENDGSGFSTDSDKKHLLFSIRDGQVDQEVYVLFFSGGKDSFLTIREMVRWATTRDHSFALILLTTFDATSRMIAHQNISIETVLKQAKHLQISLVGVPLHRGGRQYINDHNDTMGGNHKNEKQNDYYVSRIQYAIDGCIKKELQSRDSSTTCNRTIKLVFGDLHLQTIYQWRQEQLGGILGYELLFPLFQRSYSILENDLNLSQVPIEISCISFSELAPSTTKLANGEDKNDQRCTNTSHLSENDDFDNSFINKNQDKLSSGSNYMIQVGQKYDQDFRIYLRENHPSIDLFGECGEFHTVVKVWQVPRSIALGL